ncbi:hypothetical protein UAY_03349 [Enterococcus moraviensis ATCC BAA-383]|uniref:Uncharacterized protein n=1 Tax=Enterococcus moraviensis ATCC BAA-383 TaxID=1158609 RepID=R2QL73_9ENTE|nr:hypothetical protein UAY_03349 [Enterococcus moraviensis ATCC BAA-383]EOT66410.1 hypothetical protein I586_02681 [Enterococcus moraviensis ATCC BAA-383]
MRQKLLSLLTFFIFIVTLLINDSIKYYGLLSLFLFLPYFIHTVNLAIRKRLATSDSYLGQEAQRQLRFFKSKIYRMFVLVPTILLGLVLFVVYIFLVIVSSNSFELQNLSLLSISGALLIGFLWQFYVQLMS